MDVLTVGRSPENDIVADLAGMSVDRLKYGVDRLDAIVHCAAAVPGSSVQNDDAESAGLTEIMDHNVLSLAEQNECDVVYLSGCSLYHRSEPRFLEESDLLNHDLKSHYLRAKLKGDLAFCGYRRGTVVRVSTPVGVGISPKSALGLFIALARENREIKVYGHGKREQDYIDVRDVATLVRKCIQNPQYGAVNAASGKFVTMADLASLVCKMIGRGSVKLSDVEDPNAGIYSRYSIQRAKKCFDWIPSIQLPESVGSII